MRASCILGPRLRILRIHGAIRFFFYALCLAQYVLLQRRRRLIHAREAATKTQRRLAEQIGITRLALLKLELGRNQPTPALLERWVRALGLRVRVEVVVNLMPK